MDSDKIEKTVKKEGKTDLDDLSVNRMETKVE